jgi:hypothetical protein
LPVTEAPVGPPVPAVGSREYLVAKHGEIMNDLLNAQNGYQQCLGIKTMLENMIAEIDAANL